MSKITAVHLQALASYPKELGPIFDYTLVIEVDGMGARKLAFQLSRLQVREIWEMLGQALELEAKP